jgi:hypothetical protein
MYGIVDCCTNGSSDCNQGVALYGTNGSAQNILSHFGTLNSFGYGTRLQPNQICAYLRIGQHQIISLQYNYYYAQHAVVIYGIEKFDILSVIYYMNPDTDPDYGGLREVPYDNLVSGFKLPFYWDDTLIIGDVVYPDHCFNCIFEPELGEKEQDCGGPCQPCNAPSLGNCTNCKWDEGEEGIDCGGDNCPPCEDVPEERIISSTNKPPSRVMAHKKVSTSGTVEVLSGQDVGFFTSDTGSIVLRPGFYAKTGSDFVARTMDLSGWSRACEYLCPSHKINNYAYRDFWIPFRIFDLLYAVKIVYEIYDNKKRFIYGNKFDITHNGTINLWDGVTGAINTQGNVKHTIYYTVHYCDTTKKDYVHKFVVTDWYDKSSNKEYDEPIHPAPILSTPANNIIHQEETTIPEFSVTPNPNAGTFQLETNFPLSEIDNLKITNTLGVTVYESQHLVSNEIQLQNSAPGLYFVVMVLKDGTALTQKVMVQR